MLAGYMHIMYMEQNLLLSSNKISINMKQKYVRGDFLFKKANIFSK